jgi:flagellar protein FliL
MKGVAKIDILIVGAFSVATMAIAGLFYYTIYMAPKPLPKEKENLEKLAGSIKPKNLIKGIPVKRILINLPSKSSRLRFLELEINLFPFQEDQKDKISQQLPILKDTIISVVSKMAPDELNSISGKILLEERIKRNFHKSVKEKLISKIFYTKFVVQ